MPFLDEDGVTRLTEDYLDIFAQKEELGVLTKESTGEVSGPLAEVTAKGHAEQVTTTGKNLLNPVSEFNNATYYAVNADGSVKVLSADDRLWTNVTEFPLAAGTYTLSWTNNDGIVAYRTSEMEASTTSTSANGSFTTTLASSGWIKVKAYNGTFPRTMTFQLELGSTATSYEPYTGGAPSPSPNYPQEIKVARGRNLLDESSALWIDGSYINSSGQVSTQAGQNYRYLNEYIPIVGGSAYSMQIRKLTSENIGATIAFYDASKTFISRPFIVTFTTSTGVLSGTVTTPQNAAYAMISTAIPSIATELQLELGSKATPYVPYGHVGLEVKGRNLIDPSEITSESGSNGITYTKNADGTISLSGKATANTSRGLCWPNISPKLAKLISDGGTYTFSGNGPTYDFTTFNLSLGYAYGGTTYYVKLGETATIPAGATFSSVNFYASNGTTIKTADHMGLQLEAGSTAHAYQPYYDSTTPIPLPSKGFAASLPDGTSDKLSINSAGKCEWKLATKMATFDSSASFGYTVSGGHGYGSLSIPDKLNTGTTILTNFLCDKLRTGSNFEWCLYSYNTNINTMVPDTITTAAEVRDALVPVTVLYPLANPTTESGYINLPDIPGDAVVSIPELTALGLKFWVDKDGNIRTLASDYYDRVDNQKLDVDDYRKAMTWGEVGDKYNWGVLGTTSQTTGSTQTDILGLEKPGNNSTVDVDVLNDNYDIIDEAIEGTQKSIAMIESHTAQSNHAVGSYFMLDNVLHKATSAIASGETITSGTNADPITLEQALTALNTSVNSLRDSVGAGFAPTDVCGDLDNHRIGMTRYNTSTSNRPNNYGACLAFNPYADTVFQIAFPNPGQSSAPKWRGTFGTTWTAWTDFTSVLPPLS